MTKQTAWAARVAWTLTAIAGALVLAAGLLVRDAPTGVPGLEVATAEDVVDAILYLAFPLVGALLVSRDPRNLFAWAFSAVGVCFEASIFAGSYATYGTFTHPGALPAPQLLSLASDVFFVPALVLAVTLVPLLYPTGRPPTRRWWLVGAAAVASIVLAATSMAIRPGPVDEDVTNSGENPLGIGGAAGVADALALLGLALLLLAAIGSAAAVTVRFRRSTGRTRRQLRTFLFGGAVLFGVIFLPVDLVGVEGEAAEVALAVVGILALPVAVAAALVSSTRRSARTGARLGEAGGPAV
ncbi:MAG TPA: hypothetical protein VK874_00165 [Gaiellaceae bacterium]|nr:hypothetical protein [Gaiellaceae bacterium]